MYSKLFEVIYDFVFVFIPFQTFQAEKYRFVYCCTFVLSWGVVVFLKLITMSNPETESASVQNVGDSSIVILL